jgi:hypothetical protein
MIFKVLTEVMSYFACKRFHSIIFRRPLKIEIVLKDELPTFSSRSPAEPPLANFLPTSDQELWCHLAREVAHRALDTGRQFVVLGLKNKIATEPWMIVIPAAKSS